MRQHNSCHRISQIPFCRNQMVMLMIFAIKLSASYGYSDISQAKWSSFYHKARNHDPAYTDSQDTPSREVAIQFYRKAMLADPDNPLNIDLKHRIAQLLAFYGDPNKKIWPKINLAEREFKDIIRKYPINKIQCLKSHIGIGGILVVKAKFNQAVQYYRKVLDFDPNKYEKILEQMTQEQCNQYKLTVNSVRLTSVDTIAYASIRISPKYFFEQMKYIIETYPGTEIAEKAQKNSDRKAKQLANLEFVLRDAIEQELLEEESYFDSAAHGNNEINEISNDLKKQNDSSQNMTAQLPAKDNKITSNPRKDAHKIQSQESSSEKNNVRQTWNKKFLLILLLPSTLLLLFVIISKSKLRNRDVC